MEAATLAPSEGINAAMRRKFIHDAGGLALCVWLVIGLTGCVPSEARPAATPPATAAIPLPPMLGAYRIFVTDLVTGDVYALGARTYQAARSAHGLGLSPDGMSLYVSDSIGDRLVVYSLRGGKLSDAHSVRVGAQPVHMVASPDGRYVFVTNFSGSSVSVVDTRTWTLTRTIATPAAPHSIVLSPDGRTAYVACYLGASVAILDLASQSLVGSIALPSLARPYGLSVSSDGRYLYTSDNFSNQLYTVDVAARRTIAAAPLGLAPALIARSPDGRTLYVANGRAHDLSVFDVATNPAAPREVATVPLEGYPHGVSVTPDGRYVVVADTLSGNVTIVNALTRQVIATVKGMKNPNDTLALAA